MAIAMIFISCNRKINKNNEIEKNISIININKTDKLQTSHLIDSILYIPLETHSSALLTNIDKILHSDNKFFILDQINRNGVFIFSDKGNFIRKIGHKGRGPKEFVQLSNFDVYDNKVYIYDNSTMQIKVFNFQGEFIEGFKIDNNQYDFSIVDSSKIIQYWVNSYETKIYDRLKKEFSNKKPLHKAYKNNEHASPYYHIFKHHIYRSENNLFLNTYFSDIIYKVSNNSIEPYLKIESKDFIKNADIKKLVKYKHEQSIKIAQENIIIISDIFKTDNFLTFSIKNKNPSFIIYNINSKNYTDFSTLWKNQELIDIYKIFGIKDDMFISIIHPALFQEKGEFNLKYLKHFIDTNHTDYFINTGIDSNPIIAIFKFKEF